MTRITSKKQNKFKYMLKIVSKNLYGFDFKLKKRLVTYEKYEKYER